MSHLLDTNSWINYLRRGAASNVTARLTAAPKGSVYFCSVVLGELIYGVLHGDPVRQVANMLSIERLRRDFASLTFDDTAAELYAENRQHLNAHGTPIGSNDVMIASIALANHLILVTHNTREFSRVPGLQLEDWQ